MKKVLVIAYGYPPIGGVGVIRTLKFTKFLQEYGWEPYVLTVKNRDWFYTKTGNDTIPEDVNVYRSWNILNNLSIVEGGLRKLGISSKVLIPDVYCGWIPLAIETGKNIIDEGIDLIYVSCPPYSSAIIAARLKEITNVPFVIDLRDAWTLNPYNPEYVCDLAEKFDEQLENSIFKSADFIIASTDGIKDNYISKYPEVVSKITTITNGFDMDDIPTSVDEFKKFTITYTGFFYGSRSPDLFFKALSEIVTEKLIPEDDIQFIWAGREAPFVHKLIKKYGIQNIVDYRGLIAKNEADALLYQSHLLLFVIGSVENGVENNTLSGKIYPYIASNKPILAMIPDGAAKQMLEQYSNRTYIVNGVDEIKLAILLEYNEWKSGIKIGNNIDKSKKFKKQYNYKSLTGELVNVFEKVIKN